jgi:Ca2+:H+ antiporter
LLPFVSFSAECIMTVVYYVHFHLKHYLGTPLSPPKTLAEARSIDLSIQFLIFWMPLLVLLAWFTHKPLSLLFDLFEVVLLIGATFLVNYVTADAKTNWVEGVMMLALYSMIVRPVCLPGARFLTELL